MPGETNQNPYACEVPSERFEPDGLFWLEPAAIRDVDHLINATHLPTMSLGAETRAGEMADARKELADILIPSGDPLRGELGRALDIGFMYGSLIAHRSLGRGADAEPQAGLPASSDDRPMPETLRRSIGAAARGIDTDGFEGSHQLFMRLRDVEVAYAHSDLLAFSLAVTQDHMRAEFAEYHKPERHLNPTEARRLQTLYYAGALTGALMYSDERNLGKPRVEIVRAMQGPSESVALRMEFEPDDDIVDTIDSALGSKLSFSYVNSIEEEQPYVAVVASGFQYGPNTMSVPFFIPGMEEPRLMKKIPLSDVDSLVVSQTDPETGEHGSFGLMTDPRLFEAAPEGARIAGLTLNDGSCVAAYDPAHPNAEVIRGLAAKNLGAKPEDTIYRYGLEAGQPRQGFFMRNAGRIALGAGLAGPWVFDAITELADAGPTHPDQDVIVNVLTVAGYAGIRLWQRSLARNEERNEATYQLLLDQMAGYR